jgi:hypothetical protein
MMCIALSNIPGTCGKVGDHLLVSKGRGQEAPPLSIDNWQCHLVASRLALPGAWVLR